MCALRRLRCTLEANQVNTDALAALRKEVDKVTADSNRTEAAAQLEPTAHSQTRAESQSEALARSQVAGLKLRLL